MTNPTHGDTQTSDRGVTLLRLVGVCGAVALAWRAQTPLPVAGTYWPVNGAACLLAAGLLFGFAVWRRSEDQTPNRPPAGAFSVSIASLSAALILWLATVLWYATYGEGWVVYLGWPLSIAALLWSAWTRPLRRSSIPVADVLPLIVILPVALATRVWKLTTLPPLIVGDSLWGGEQARAILNGTQQHLIGFGWANIPLPGYVPEVISMALFGDNLFGVCMSAVLVGMASLVATYLLAFELFGPRVAWLATGLLAVSYTHVHFSRVPPHMHPLPFTLLSLYYIARAARTGRSWDAVLGGVFAGASFQMYFAGRVIVILAGLVAAHQVVLRRFSFRQWALILLAFGITLGPMPIFVARRWDLFTERALAVWSLGSEAHPYVSVWQKLLQHCKLSFLTFWYYGNAWGERDLGRPMFDWFTGVLFALGLGHALVRLARPRNWLLISALAAVVVLGGVLTVNPPFWQRMTAVVPLAAILAAVALDECARLVPLPRALLATTLFAMLTAVGYRNWTYLVHHESVRDSPWSAVARYASTIAQARDIEMVGMPWHPVIEGYVRFLAPRHRVRQMSLDDAREGRWPSFRAKPLVLLMPPDRDLLLPALKANWPQGFIHELRLADGNPAVDMYEPGPAS